VLGDDLDEDLPLDGVLAETRDDLDEAACSSTRGEHRARLRS
jgi:hypothetical protein